MVIKRSPGGESAGGGQSTLKSTSAVPAWSLTAFGDRPACNMSKLSAGVNSDLGNSSFWLEIRDAEHEDQCSWKCKRVWSYQLTSELRNVYFFKTCLQWSCLKAVSVPTFVSNRRPAGLHRDERSCLKKFVLFGKVAVLQRWTRRSPSTTRWPNETSAHFFSSGAGDCAADLLDRKRVKKSGAIRQAHGQILKQAHKGRLLFNVRHYATTMIIFSIILKENGLCASESSKDLLSSSIQTVKRRPVIPSTNHVRQSLFLPVFSFSESCVSLHILVRWKCRSTTLYWR